MIRGAARIARAARDGATHFYRSHGMVYSAAVAFNVLLSCIPILFLVFVAMVLVLGKGGLPYEALGRFLKENVPYGERVLIPSLKGLIASRAAIGIAGGVLLLFSSFSATDAVHKSLSVMLGVRDRKRFLRSVVFHAGFVLTLTVIAFASVIVPPLWKGLAIMTRGMSYGLDSAFHVLLNAAEGIGLTGIVFLGGVLSYRYLSPVTIRWRQALAGGAAFVLLLFAIRWGFTFYVKKFSRLNIIYGSLFGIICFIIVTYLSAAAYLFCASVIGVLHREAGDAPLHRKGGGAKES